MTTAPLFEVRDLKTYFFTREGIVKAVDGVSFHVAPGATLGIVGESGSGKSVTNLSALRLIPEPPGKIVGGEVLFEGKNLLSLAPEAMRRVRGNHVSMIFQDPMTSLNPLLKISRQLTEVLQVHKGITYRQALVKSVEMLDLVGIPSPQTRIHDYAHQFSGGMRQRVMIAMALLCQPKLLIADEPTTALDVTIQAQILDLLKKLQGEFHMTIILVTHNLGVAATMCDHISVMYAGRVVEFGTAGEIFEKPKHPYTVGLLRSVPRLDEATTDRLATIPGQPPDLLNLPQGCPYYPRCDYRVARCCKEYPIAQNFEPGHFSHCWQAKEVTK
ncbi:MAG: ABC transporter ATP-binding protein [Deltaproteobacteria bacterium]|nr:ABC transporter ATP-binding protein [Deltaproteobacteria bacterium]